MGAFSECLKVNPSINFVLAIEPEYWYAAFRMEDVADKLERGELLSTKELLEYLPTLKEVPATLLEKYSAGAAARRTFRAGDIVCEEGEFGSTAFYIVSGHVEIFISNPLAAVRTQPKGGLGSFFKRMSSMLVPGSGKDESSPAEQGFIPIDASVDLPRTTPLAYLGAGELFGEMTCRTFQPRSATVRATEDCVMVEMLRVILDMLVGTRDPDAETKQTTKVRAPTFKGTSFKKQMDDQYRERSLVAHLRGVPLFATLDLEFFNYLKEHAQLISFNKGEVICKQGDPADAFYLIRTGLVRVSQAMPGGEMVKTYLKKGEYFGEIGLLFDQARNATCSALNAVDLVKIDKETFQLLLERFPIVRATLAQIAKLRAESAKDRKLPAGLQLDEFLNQGLFEAQNLLLIDLDHCTRCDACVNSCADAHDGITRLIRDGLRYDRYLVATACRSCRDPLCMTQCPVGSIRRKESLEIIIEDWCIGCSKCAELCPYGNINMHSFDVMKEVAAAPEKPAAKAPAPAAGKTETQAKPASPATPKPAAAKAPAAKPASTEAAPVAAGAKPETVAPQEKPAQNAVASKPQPLNTLAPLAGDPPPTAQRPGERPVTSPEPKAVADKPPTEPTVPAGEGSAVATKAPAVVPETKSAPVASAPATPAKVPESPKPAATAPEKKSDAAAPAKTAAPAPAPEAASAAKPAAPPKKMVKKKVSVSKATTCDLCTQLSVPSCVYACPHEAAMRVDPTKFLAEQIGRKRGDVKRRFKWLGGTGENRTTH